MREYFNSAALFLGIILLYILIVVYIRDFDLLNNTIAGSYPSSYKFTIIKGAIYGLPYSLTTYEAIIILIIAALTAINIVLLVRRIELLRSSGKLKFTLGGGILIGIGSAGCAACGLPFLAFLGVGGSLGFLPFDGAEFSFLTILLLIFSIVIIARGNRETVKCKVPSGKKRN